MSQPTKGMVHINRPLTNISVAFMQDANEYVADRVFPRVPVNKQSDSYFVYDKEAFARAIAADRSGATESVGGGYEIATATYSCRQKSFHKDVPSDVAANSDEPLDAFRDATEFVTRAMLLKREADFAASFFTTGIWTNGATLAGATQWSDPSSNPIDAVKAAVRTVQAACLVKPNKLVVGPQVFDALSEHPDIVDRYKYTNANTLTREMIAQMLGVDEILVGEGVQVTSVEGQTTTTGYIFGKHALLVYAAPRPSLLMPSGGYNFTWKAYGNDYGARIRRFPMTHLNDAERIEGDMAYDSKVVAPDAGYFFNNAVA